MKKILVLLLYATGLWAQVPTTVTGLITDTGGNPATSGYVQFDIAPSAGAVQYFVSGINTIAPQSVQCPINGTGHISCSLWGNDIISPANTTYTVTLAPNGNVTNVINGECITNTAPYDLNTPHFCPIVQVNPQQAIIRANPFQTNIIPPADSVFTVGSPQAWWAAGYFRNLFVGKINGFVPGTLTSVGLSMPSWLSVANSPVTTTGTLTVTPTAGQAPHQVIGTCGALTSFQPCTLTAADVTGLSGGTVTTFSAGNLSPLFTTNVANPTSTPALSFTLDSQTANTIFAGPSSGPVAAPTFRNMVVADLPINIPNANLQNPSTTVNGTTCTLGASCTVGFGGLTAFFHGEVVAPCTPGSGSSYDACTDTLTWSGTFADTNYIPVCTGAQSAVDGGNPATNQAPTLVIGDKGTWTTTTIPVITQQQRTTVSKFTRIECIGVHP